jgi:hypothetical protein
VNLTINLNEKWKPYKAAHYALTNNTDPLKVANYSLELTNSLRNIQLPTGQLLLNEFNNYIDLAVTYNASLKWRILHQSDMHLL